MSALFGVFKTISPVNPIATMRSCRSATAMTPGTTYPAGSRLAVVATVAGNVVAMLEDGSTFTFPVPVGLTFLDLMVVQIVAAGTTATATYTNLR